MPLTSMLLVVPWLSACSTCAACGPVSMAKIKVCTEVPPVAVPGIIEPKEIAVVLRESAGVLPQAVPSTLIQNETLSPDWYW